MRGPSSIYVPNLKWIPQFIEKLLMGPKIRKIRSRDPSHAHLGVGLCSLRREVPSSVSVPNLKWITIFDQKLLVGPTFRPAAEPLPQGAGWPKFNQLEMVTTFTYKPSLVGIDARNFELSW